MNQFGFRSVKDSGMYRAEYRMGHWGAYRAVRTDDGEPVRYSHAMDATVAAASALVAALNSDIRSWIGGSREAVRANAERYFKPTGTRDEGGAKEAGCASGWGEAHRSHGTASSP